MIKLKTFMEKKGRFFSLLCILLFVFAGVLSQPVFADEVTLEVNTRLGLQNAVDDAATTPTTIVITEDITFDNQPVTIKKDADITMKSKDGSNFKLVQTASDTRHILVQDGASLTLGNITLDGTGESTVSSGGGIEVNGSLNTGAETVIQKCKRTKTTTNPGGAAVQVTGSGTYTMSGSKLTENYSMVGGGAVFIETSGNFNMKSGSIVHNKCRLNGGAVYNRGTFVMEDGRVEENESTDGSGGGVCSYQGTFTMKKGSVINNTAYTSGGGISNLVSACTMEKGTVSKNIATQMMGGGVYNSSGTFTMQGGTISENKSRYQFPADSQNTSYIGGGGVCNEGGTFNLQSGTIENNKSGHRGGGVYNNTGTFDMKGGTIKDNETGSYGGGIYFHDAAVTIEEGTIADNKATSGGGIYLRKNQLNINNGLIRGNTADTGDGGGIYFEKAANLNITGTDGACQITNNNAQDGNGGGIFSEDTDYVNLVTAENTVFSKNKASALYDPPANVSTTYPAIGFASISIPNAVEHPLNNYDINFDAGTELVPCKVTFDSNGGSSVPSQTAYIGKTVKKPKEPTKKNQTFAGWYPTKDTSGAAWDFAEDIVTGEFTLYAKWTPSAGNPDGGDDGTGDKTGDKTKEYNGKSVMTGDSNNLPLLILLICLSLTIMGLLFWKRKSSKK